MTVTLGLHERSLAHIGGRLVALDLDLRILPFDDTGHFLVDGRAAPPGEVDLDYVWLSPHIGQGSKASRRSATETAFETVLACRRVDLLQTFNAGLDDPFYGRAADRGIRICNSSAQGIAIAEHVFAQVLSIFHPIDVQRARQKSRRWQATRFREIAGTTWLIVGFGAIGREIARRARAFGATVWAVRRSASGSDLADRAGTLADLPSLAPEADVTVLACSLNKKTRHVVDAGFLAAMKPDSVLVNIARGEVIDEAVLIPALDAGRPGLALLDVFTNEPLPADHPLWTHPRVRLTAHASFAGSGVQGRWDRLFLDNIRRYARGEPLLREVAPEDIRNQSQSRRNETSGMSAGGIG